MELKPLGKIRGDVSSVGKLHQFDD
jgi:hypothetical protein